ncbi:fibronectin type III-like domain-contianing protein [Microbacterium karelineae]|uniref:fibronectin type III-like domain-contianing protein n=1 Tax=Microbacterium karelineae TaxID=2654283 RepID=UPI0012E9C7D7|nr:fibronectin type III-like domain-contianing protein [Microbacterium karelineae]
MPTQTDAQYPGIVDDEGVRQVDCSAGLEVGCRWYESPGIEPLLALGHGLSCSAFEAAQVRVTLRSTSGKGDVAMRFRPTNAGDVDGTEAAQEYVASPDEADAQSKRLIAFARADLDPGAHESVSIRMSDDDLAALRALQYSDDVTGSWVTPSGASEGSAGGSIETDQSTEFEVRQLTAARIPRNRAAAGALRDVPRESSPRVFFFVNGSFSRGVFAGPPGDDRARR